MQPPTHTFHPNGATNGHSLGETSSCCRRLCPLLLLSYLRKPHSPPPIRASSSSSSFSSSCPIHTPRLCVLALSKEQQRDPLKLSSIALVLDDPRDRLLTGLRKLNTTFCIFSVSLFQLCQFHLPSFAIPPAIVAFTLAAWTGPPACPYFPRRHHDSRPKAGWQADEIVALLGAPLSKIVEAVAVTDGQQQQQRLLFPLTEPMVPRA